jgi:hypothetical protein
MNKRLISIALIVCLASIFVLGNVKAQTLYNPQTFNYKVTSQWSSSDQSAMPQELQDINHIDHVEVRVITTDGINVDTFMATFFNNGSSPTASSGTTNLQTGETQGGFAAIISPNLAQGDTIHPSGNDLITINSTALRTYENGTRPTNEITISVRNSTIGVTTSLDRFFDQATGMLVQSTESNTYDNPSSSSTVTWQVESSTAWAIPEFPVIIVLPAFFIATALAALAYKRKHSVVPIKI